MAGPKPFMVCGISTKWHGPKTHKTPVRKLSWTPLGTSTEERSSGPRKDPTKQTSRPGRLPTVVPKVDRPRPPPKPMPHQLPSKTPKVQKSLPFPLVPSPDRSLSKKTVVPRPLKIVARSKEGKVIAGSPASLPVTSKVTTAKQLPSRPNYVPRTTACRSSVGVMATSKEKHGVPPKVSTIGPCYSGIGRKQSINIGTTKAGGRVKVAETLAKKPMMVGGCLTGARAPKVIAYPHALEPAFPIASSPPPSPDLSSFPSQSWTIVVDMGVEQIKTLTKSCGNESLSSMSDAANSGVAGMPKDSYGRSASESVSSSPALSLSSTVIETPVRLAEPIGLDSMVKISSKTKEPSTSTWVSDTVCAATIISPERNSTTSSMATLAKVMERSQPSSPTKVSDNGNRMTVRSAVETIRAFFSASERTLQSGSEVTPSTTVDIDAARIRKLLVPPLNKDANPLKNHMTQIEMLRGRKAAGDGVSDPRLDHLGSPAAMATVTKIRTSSSDSPGQV